MSELATWRSFPHSARHQVERRCGPIAAAVFDHQFRKRLQHFDVETSLRLAQEVIEVRWNKRLYLRLE